MRRALLVVGILALVGCGISAVATRDGAGATDTPDAKTDPNIPDTSAPPGEGGPAPDAEVDGGSEGGVGFAPSHLKIGDYALDAGDVDLTDDTVIDTDLLTVDKGPNRILTPSQDGKLAVWSVGTLTTDAHITVKGTHGLAIVASGDVSLKGLMSAGASLTTAGPGGFAATLGDGKGTSGTNAKDLMMVVRFFSGGGGAGGFTKGGIGGKSGGADGGAGGIITTPIDLVGGSGGGNGGNNGGGSAACGHGGPGGGAVQISAMGTIVLNDEAVIDVSGGGGSGGCQDNDLSAGGGGGAGGLILLEAIARITLETGATVIASGGGGGEGGDVMAFGGDGNPGGIGNSGAPLGAGGKDGTTFGGHGGNGGVGPTASPTNPVDADTNARAGGGGGGALGRVYFRSRGNNFAIQGAVYAASVQDPSF